MWTCSGRIAHAKIESLARAAYSAKPAAMESICSELNSTGVRLRALLAAKQGTREMYAHVYIGLLLRSRRVRQKKNPAWDFSQAGLKNLAIPTFASALTIIGPECLTTVFGMGTGVSTTVWSPEEASGAIKPAGA